MEHTTKGHVFTQIVLETFKFSGLLATEGDKLAAPFQLSSARWKVLGALTLTAEPLTVSQIARSMGQTRQAVQRLVDVMCKDDILTLLENPYHKRAKLVTLTEKGSSVFGQLEAKQIPWANGIATDINEEDLSTTLKTIQKLTTQLDGDED
ncbi:MarR family winged helix-turn-helix transcriptional regulator [Thalassotalea fusca]